jgi:hypothetical protein
MRRLLVLAVLALTLSPASSFAVTSEDFLVADTQDVVDICSTPESDPLYTAAMGFCQGYVLGAYQYHLALFGHGKSHPMVCFTEPKPTRTQAIERFIAWVKGHPEYGKEQPADSLTKFLIDTWPCPKTAAKKSTRSGK